MRRAHQGIIALSLVVGAVFVGGIGLIALRLFVINYSQIPQDGMFPTMPAGTRFFTLRRPYRDISEVKRGDVVIFIKNLDGQSFKFVWRVIGLPGEQLEVADEAVKINGQLLKHEPIRTQGNFSIVREWSGETSYEVAYDQNVSEPPKPYAALTVPVGHFFLLGDNRDYAQDSTLIGPIPFSSIVEKRIF